MKPLFPRFALSGGLVAALLLTACALSPQTVEVTPTITIDPAAVGHGRSLALDVVDARPRAEFGTRGGVYGVTSTIGPAGDITVGVRKAMAEALTTEGFRLVDAGSPADVSMRVNIDDIHYVAGGDPIVRSVETSARVSTLIRRGGQEYTGRATVTQTKEVFKAPEAAENETLINTTVSQALEKLLRTSDLIDFIR